MVQRFRPLAWLLFPALIGASAPASDPAPEGGEASGPVARYLAAPAGSRIAVIEEDPASFQAAFDSLLADPGSDLERNRGSLEGAAEAYLEVTADSLLLSDLQFALFAPLDSLREWYEAVALDARGFDLRAAKQYEASAAAFEEVASTYRRLGHLRREAVAWGSLGVSAWYTGDLERVRSAYVNALDARERLGDPVLVGRTLNGLGSVNLNLGDYRTSLDYYRKAETIRRTLNNPVELGATVTYIGHVQFRLGNLDAARLSYLEALDLFGEDAPARNINEALGGLANVYSNLGEHNEALAIDRRILDSADAGGDTRLAALTRGNLGMDLYRTGDYAGAIREFEFARDTQEKENDRFALTLTMNRLGGVYRSLGDNARALEAYQRAEALGKESENKLETMNAQLNLGRTYREMGLGDKAVGFFETALEQAQAMEYPEGVRDALFNKAMTMEEKGARVEALGLYQECLTRDVELGSSLSQAADHLAIGNTLAALSRFEEAKRELNSSLEMGRNLDMNAVIWRAFLGLADCFEQEGRLDSAEVYNGKAIDTLEQVGLGSFNEETQAAFRGNGAFVYEAQINVLAKLEARDPEKGRVEEALLTAERGKARAFLDRLAESSFELDSGSKSVVSARRDSVERVLRSKLYELRLAENSGVSADSLRVLRRARSALQRELVSLVERMRMENPRLSTIQAATPVGFREIRDALVTNGDRALLEYSLGDTASYLWTITVDRAALFRLPPRDTIETQARDFRESLLNPALGDTARLLARSRRLYETVLAPAAGMVKSKKTIFIVPDGILHFIPFEALVGASSPSGPSDGDEGGEGGALERTHYVFDEAALYYGPSATSLVALADLRQSHSTERPPGEFLGIGDPEFAAASESSQGGPALSRLPESRREIISAASWFPEEERLLLLGREASERRLTDRGLMGGYRILHFATHGLIDERRPEFSGLALSYPQDDSEDGYLQASEIYGLTLHADLVVLSACETGRGRLVRGEGVLGLPRAFLYAGATRVLVSLWEVSDRSTASLMETFYGSLVGGKTEPGEALRRARNHVRTMQGYEHPFYWAPFVLVGPD